MYILEDKNRNYNRLYYTRHDRHKWKYQKSQYNDESKKLLIKTIAFVLFMDTCIDYEHIEIEDYQPLLKLTIII